MQFQKHHMTGHNYNWDSDEEKSFSGEPTRRLFNRYNGNQVLFIINYYGSLSDNFTLQEGRLIEEKIIHHLPLDTKSEISVFNWIHNILLRENQ